MSSRLAGSCLCGTVRYAVEGALERFFLCHCSHCRKDTGSAHAANLFSSTARLTWLAGQDQVSHYQLPGTRHARSFCSLCGSAMPLARPGMVVVPAGSLDTDLSMTPDGNLFTASRAAWDHDLHRAPDYAAFPP